MNFGSQILSRGITGWYKWVDTVDKDVFSSDWHGLFWISVFKLSIQQIIYKNYQKHRKNTLQGYFGSQTLKIQKHTQQHVPDCLREYMWS